MSKEEDMLYNHLRSVFELNKGNSIRNWRPKVLVNPKTGCRLELDIYIGKFPVGFEYQGDVHFKDIKKYNNNSDKSRYNDLVKHYISLNPSKGHKITIIEIFKIDLDANIYKNILRRIINTRDYYIKMKLFGKALSIECLLLFYINRLDIRNHIIAWKKGYIYQQKPQLCLLLNYKLMRTLFAISLFARARGYGYNKKHYFNVYLEEETKDYVLPFINKDYELVENINEIISKNSNEQGDYHG